MVSWAPATSYHRPPRLEPTSPLPSTGSARPAPGAPTPGPSPPLCSPGSWEGMGKEVPGIHPPRLQPAVRSCPPALERATGTHLQRMMKSLSSSKACSRSPSSSCSARTCSASSGSSGTSAPASSGLQGGGSLGHRGPSVSLPRPRPPGTSSLTCVAPEMTVRCFSRRHPRRPSATAAGSPGPSVGGGSRGQTRCRGQGSEAGQCRWTE